MAIDPNWVRENPEEAARQIELLTIERDQYRAAEEAQIALKEKSQARVRLLAAHVVDIGGHLKGYAQHLRDAMSELPDNDEGDWKRKHLNRLLKDVIAAQEHKVPTDSVSRLIASKQAEALEEAYKHTDDAAAQDYLHDSANALRRQAEGGHQ